ncbi:tetratricopeptide repeat protein [Alteromonas sp. ASW11-36]|uniref:Tetratricopeptide repeat protein n=1 Tax=Alteromonas arenosi TaxID=3055817 RepID=A0ABT7SUE9_9ALTE|nr:tetratricopeptide repeat protein [Alteromonas sp. ASW11-36]MDM7859824.1 tetratricopeptide repeat protein [Alteromonas sp. ASW11-36]
MSLAMKVQSVLLILLVCLATTAEAKRKKTYAMSLNVFRAVEQINLLVDNEETQEALLELEETLSWSRLTKYEKAQLYYLKGTILYKQDGEAASMPAFSRVLDYAGDIPDFLHQRVTRTLMQLNLVLEDYSSARELGQQLIAISETPSADDWTLLAQANYKLSDWQAALEAIQAAREINRLAGKVPKENVLLLQNATYFELKQMDNMITTLETLIKHYPKSTYILYLASIFGQVDRLDKQTVLMESLYEAGKLTDSSQLINLASLYMSEKVPIKAAHLLEAAIDDSTIKGSQRNYEMLSQAWRLAAEDELSMATLAKAANLADDGELTLRLAYLLYDSNQWRKAAETAKLAIERGLTPKYVGESYLLIGMANFNMNAYTAAITACERAAEYPDSRDLAERWVSYIATEQEKVIAMQAVN